MKCGNIVVSGASPPEPPIYVVRRGKIHVRLHWHEFVKREDGSYMHPYKLRKGDVVRVYTSNIDPARVRVQYWHD